MDLSIKEGMKVVGADGAAVGTVDRVEGQTIKLAEQHSEGTKGDHHHEICLGQVSHVDGQTVWLDADAASFGLEQKKTFPE